MKWIISVSARCCMFLLSESLYIVTLTSMLPYPWLLLMPKRKNVRDVARCNTIIVIYTLAESKSCSHTTKVYCVIQHRVLICCFLITAGLVGEKHLTLQALIIDINLALYDLLCQLCWQTWLKFNLNHLYL